MATLMTGFLSLVLLVTLTSSAEEKGPTTVAVDMANGEVVGKVVRKKDGSITTQFLGVPYAAPPVGKHRFQKPKDVKKWLDNPRKAMKQPPLCAQNVTGSKFWMHPEVKVDLKPTKETSEDCLYLNIYVPFDPVTNRKRIANLNLPVMVFFHGGGFQVGGPDQYSCARLAHFGEVMVVNVQYRLNVFGFLSTGDGQAKGNYGLYDQRKALSFINGNIHYFGGNSGMVTIFGNSAGGTSVGYHVMSPISANEFKGAISMSGSALSPTIGDPKRTKALTVELGRLLNCSRKRLRDIVHCMRNRSTNDILSALHKAEQEVGYKYMPMVDGEFIQRDPLVQVQNGDFSNNKIDYIIGVTSDEGYWYQKRDIPYNLEDGVDMIQFEDTMRKFFKKETAFKSNYEQIMGIIRTEYGHCDNDTSRSKGLVDSFGEYSVIAPAYRFTQEFAKYHKVYFYEFAHRPSHWESPLANGRLPDFVRASHYADINYIFADIQYLASKAPQDEKDLSFNMMRMWVNFAKFGDPNKEGLSATIGTLEWLPFTTNEPNFLQITTNLNDSNLKKGFRKRRMTFWNQYMPFLLEESPCDQSADYCVYDASRALNFEVLTYSLCAFSLVLLLLVLILAAKVIFPECCAKGDDASNGTATLVKAAPVEEKEKLSNLSKDIDEISESDL